MAEPVYKKAFIFDMDGTIVHNVPYHTKAWIEFLNRYNIRISEEVLHTKIFGGSEEIMPRFFGKDLSGERNKSLSLEKETLYRGLYKEHIKELRGFTQLMQFAKARNIALALATMSDSENVRFIIDGLGIREMFDTIASADHVIRGKPHPEIYELVLSTLHIGPEEAIVFEDSEGGVLSATAAGIDVVGICTTHSKEQFGEWGVTICINDFEEYISLYF